MVLICSEGLFLIKIHVPVLKIRNSGYAKNIKSESSKNLSEDENVFRYPTENARNEFASGHEVGTNGRKGSGQPDWLGYTRPWG